MPEPGVEQHAYQITTDCSYILHVPESIEDSTLVFAGLHGYGSNAVDMLRFTELATGRRHIVASLQAPNQHYSGALGADAVAGYNWGIRQHWQAAVDTHHRMLNAVLLQLRQRFGIGAGRTILMGFSQPVSLNYRFAATHPGQVGGVIGICGGVPRDWEEGNYHPTDAAILHIARDEDEFYPISTVQQFPQRLRRYAQDVEFHLLPGPHRFPSKSAPLIQRWLKSRFLQGYNSTSNL